MQTEEITIRVDPEAAQAYRTAPEEERRKLDLLLSLRLQDALRPGGSLKELMRDISRKAQERGLTPEVLEAILHEP
jgi:Flp pilus assembly protein TadB